MECTQIFTILVIVLSYFILDFCECGQCSNLEILNITRDKTLKNLMFETFPNFRSLGVCVDLCKARTLCKSANLDPAKGTCELNIRNKDEMTLNYIDGPGQFYIDIKNSSKQLCTNIHCPDDGLCLKGANQMPVCVRDGSDCGPPPTIFGGIVSYTSTAMGSVARLSCRDGFIAKGSYTYIVCQRNGSWSDVGFRCEDCMYHMYAYMGHRNRTVSGRVCQRWNSNYPQSNNYINAFFREGSSMLAENYCRVPNEEGFDPWCYTTDPTVRWEFCGIPYCIECFTTPSTYIGRRSTTIGGLTCQRWDQQSPHRHPFTRDLNFPDPKVRYAENFCRSPDPADEDKTEPWCYTTDPNVEWDLCGIRKCSDCYNTFTPYRGTRRHTKSNIRCQRWDAQQPHPHPYTDSDFPDGSVSAAKNLCRAVGGLEPWCYTINPNVEWEPCGVPVCV